MNSRPKQTMRNIIMAEIRAGYGADDIAYRNEPHITAEQVREMVEEIRGIGLFKKPGFFAPVKKP